MSLNNVAKNVSLECAGNVANNPENMMDEDELSTSTHSASLQQECVVKSVSDIQSEKQQEKTLKQNSNIRKKKFKPLQNSNCVYTSCYCEENVWNLCDEIRKNNPEELHQYYAVFISNKNKQIPIWMQKSSMDPLSPIIWDYHVIIIQKPGNEEKPLVYDLDSIMAFPCLLEHYLIQAIQCEKQLKKEFHRKFRIIEAEDYLSTFASDRSHMRQPNGEYVKPPPNYPPIRTPGEEMNLDEFISMSPSNGLVGRIRDLKGLIKFFGV